MKKILLGLTTTPGSDWREKTKEIDRLGINEIALFPTFLKPNERQELYNLLEKTRLVSIPHVHLRSDHSDEEIRYLIDRYHATLFNLHPDSLGKIGIAQMERLGIPYFIENTGEIEADFESLVKKAAGLCVDFSHFHDHWALVHEEGYRAFSKIIDKYPIGCCHVSAIKPEKHYEFNGEFRYGLHAFSDLSDLDYMKNYLAYLPEYISLELENSFKEQLSAQNYLNKIINK